jgi:tRNA-splicing ligase RtcB
MNTSNPTPIQPTGEATGFIPVPGDKGKPITVIGSAAIRETFDAKCIEQALNSRDAPASAI